MLDLEKIEQICKGVDEHLRKLESMTDILREVKCSLNELRHSQERNYSYELQNMRRALADLTEQLSKRGLPHADKYEKEFHESRQLTERADWPLAVEPQQICDSEEKAFKRADAILDLLVAEHMKNKKFLDFGCGEGHVVMKAFERETKSVCGYDVDLSKLKFTNPVFTDHFDEVKRKAPYDIILLHDVLDHAVLMDPIQILSQARSVLASKGRIYVRNHPWCSRHGGHLYEQKNKAFLHLIFDAVELTRMGGYQCSPNVRVTTPLDTYRHWFKEAGFKMISEIPIKDVVEPFFLTPSAIHDRLKKNFENPHTVMDQLEISMVEYVLEPNLQQQII